MQNTNDLILNYSLNHSVNQQQQQQYHSNDNSSNSKSSSNSIPFHTQMNAQQLQLHLQLQKQIQQQQHKLTNNNNSNKGVNNNNNNNKLTDDDYKYYDDDEDGTNDHNPHHHYNRPGPGPGEDEEHDDEQDDYDDDNDELDDDDEDLEEDYSTNSNSNSKLNNQDLLASHHSFKSKQSIQSNSNNNNSNNSLAKRPKGELICVVCGASANGYNFDAITCESCKAFFRRNAFRPLNLFRCSNNNACVITVQTRKKCKKCRIVKCFNLGMRRDWIMTEIEREEKRRKIEENRKKKATGPGISNDYQIGSVQSPDCQYGGTMNLNGSIGQLSRQDSDQSSSILLNQPPPNAKPIRRRRRRRRHSLYDGTNPPNSNSSNNNNNNNSVSTSSTSNSNNSNSNQQQTNSNKSSVSSLSSSSSQPLQRSLSKASQLNASFDESLNNNNKVNNNNNYNITNANTKTTPPTTNNSMSSTPSSNPNTPKPLTTTSSTSNSSQSNALYANLKPIIQNSHHVHNHANHNSLHANSSNLHHHQQQQQQHNPLNQHQHQPDLFSVAAAAAAAKLAYESVSVKNSSIVESEISSKSYHNAHSHSHHHHHRHNQPLTSLASSLAASHYTNTPHQASNLYPHNNSLNYKQQQINNDNHYSNASIPRSSSPTSSYNLLNNNMSSVSAGCSGSQHEPLSSADYMDDHNSPYTSYDDRVRRRRRRKQKSSLESSIINDKSTLSRYYSSDQNYEESIEDADNNIYQDHHHNHHHHHFTNNNNHLIHNHNLTHHPHPHHRHHQHQHSSQNHINTNHPHLHHPYSHMTSPPRPSSCTNACNCPNTLSPQSLCSPSRHSTPPSNSTSPTLNDHHHHHQQNSNDSTSNNSSNLKDLQSNQINAIRLAYKQAIQLVKAQGTPRNSEDINTTINLTELGVRRIIFFFKLIADFRNLEHDLMVKLLKQSMMSILQIHGVNSYNKIDNTFKEPDTDDTPFSAQSLEAVYGPEIYKLTISITLNLYELCHDDMTYIKILMLIVLFDPLNENLTEDEKRFIKKIQDKYMSLLYAYMCENFGNEKATLVFKGMMFETNKINDLGRWFEKAVVEKSNYEYVRPLMKEVFSFPSDNTPPSSIASTFSSSNNSENSGSGGVNLQPSSSTYSSVANTPVVDISGDKETNFKLADIRLESSPDRRSTKIEGDLVKN